nr:uncharacterized protein LOC116769075 [Danaus plexippus plexippus]
MLLFELISKIIIVVISVLPTKLCDETLRRTAPVTSVEVIVKDERLLRAICPQFKNVGEINLDGMVGLWRPVYYQVSYNVPCHDMLIRKVTSKEKNQNNEKYGDFNGTVIWDDCNLEIKTSDSSRKHFLQGCHKGLGVLENIVVDLKDKTPTLIDETADQWLVMENLLLMKDCVSGKIVIFSRNSYQPKLHEVKKAIRGFGTNGEGDWACRETKRTGEPQAFDGEYESDSDVIFFE